MESVVTRLALFVAFCACLLSSSRAIPTLTAQAFPTALNGPSHALDSYSQSQNTHDGSSHSVDGPTIQASPESDSASEIHNPDEIKLMEQISQVFGIGNYSGINAGAGKIRKDKTPRFMLSLYNSIANSTNGEERADTPYHASTIRSVRNERARGSSRRVLQFKIDVIPTSERLLNAELYLYRLVPKLKGDRPRFYQVGIYQRMQTGLPQLVDSKRVSSHGTGWEIFNVHQTVRDWMADETSNLGLDINVTSLSGEPVQEGALRFSLKKEDTRPNLVLFIKEKSDRDDATEFGNGRSTPTTQRPLMAVPARNHRTKRDAKVTEEPTEKTCGIEPMYVNFEQLGWTEHIVAPMGFNTNRCSGHCPFPAKEDIPYSTHALIQSFMAMEYPSIEAACCVPHELSSLTFLYVDGLHNVVLRRVRNAVAVKCGCH